VSFQEPDDAGIPFRRRNLFLAVTPNSEQKFTPHSALTYSHILMTVGRTAEGQRELTTAVHLARTIHPDYQASLIHQIKQTPH
jgi:hypothetical protein